MLKKFAITKEEQKKITGGTASSHPYECEPNGQVYCPNTGRYVRCNYPGPSYC